METRTKIIFGVGAVVTLGLVAYFTRNMWMPKKEEEKDINTETGGTGSGTGTGTGTVKETTDGGVKEAPKKPILMYLKSASDTAYSYPEAKTSNQVGRIRRNGSKAIGQYLAPSSSKGWFKARAVVESYRWDDKTKTYPSSVQDVFLKTDNYTYIAP